MTDSPNNLELQKTPDGSYTLLRTDIGETYHSRHGALTESQHVFIENGLKLNNKKELVVLEVGLGTMLNAYLAAQYAEENKIKINYWALENYPVPSEFLHRPKMHWDSEQLQYKKLIASSWEKEISLNPYFTISKLETDALAYQPKVNIDIIFFDAFAPNYQGEMWDKEYFQRLYNQLNPDGIFTTYCAKGSVRRDLESVGFTIERKPGPPGKREMLVGFRK